MRRSICLVMALLCTLCMTACQSAPTTGQTTATLPPAQCAYDAPTNDNALDYTDTVALYLPSRDGQRLLVHWSAVSLSHSRHAAEAVVRALLAFEGNDMVTALGGRVGLTLYGARPVTVSGGVCTVNLASSALQLDAAAYYRVCLGLSATLTALEDVQYVNVLVADQAVGLDIAGYLPTGSMTGHPGEELAVLQEQIEARRTPLGENPAAYPLTCPATLYFPLADGTGVVPETRNLSFAGQTPQQLAAVLVSALSVGAQYVTGTAAMPDLNALMTASPDVSELAETGGRLVTLRFSEDMEQRLQAADIDMACFVGALTLTLTTFIPSVAAVRVQLGDTQLTSLYNRVHGMLTFNGGLQRRDDFARYLMAQTTLYFASGSRLKATLRAVSCDQSADPRILLSLLMQGPSQSEAEAGLEPTLPEGLSDGDVIGLSITGDTLLVNLSAHFAEAIRTSAGDYEQALCYSIVNTLCEAKGLKRARFFFGGDVTEGLAGSLYWAGEFLLCPGLIDRTMG